MDRNVLVDGNNVLHQAYHVFVKDHPDPFKSRSGYPTGLIYGTLNMLSSWVLSMERFTHLRFFLDGVPARRKEMDSDYKDRDSDGFNPHEDSRITLCDGYEAFNEIDVLSHILHLLGGETYFHPREEADDLIASFVRKNPGNIHIIVSSDKDFYQLLSDTVVQYRPGIKKGSRLYDASRVESELGVPPSMVRLYKSLVSDTSDNVPGVFRVRRKVIASLCRHGSVDAILKSDLKPASPAERQKILDFADRMRLNYELVGMVDTIDVEACCRRLDPDPAMASRILKEDLDIFGLDADFLVPRRIGFTRVSDPIECAPVAILDDSWLKDLI